MDAVEEIKSRLSIEDVIGEYVQLKRAGRNWKGLSPLSNEKTPSFMVSPDKQIWHDFSSGKGGDMFSFVMLMEGIEFKEALEQLARKAGVDLEQYRRPGQAKGPDKAKLREVLELSTKFYQAQLGGSQLAIDYVFKKRQFTKQTALDWRLGYAPNNGTALVDFLKKRGISEADIKLAGLTSRWGKDLFRERLMIPLCDGQGQVVGFTARLLRDIEGAPKYINTPATPLYDKSRHVFGLHHAKPAIRQAKYAVLAEGNLDVIMSHQASVKQVVATAGTALTEQHLKALSRLTGDIRLSFDADQAGLNATERAIPIASKAKVSLSVITIPSGKDPDELIKQDAAKWQAIIEQPQYALDWLMARYESQLNIATAEGKRRYSDALLAVIKNLDDPVEQDHYIGALATKLDASKEALAAKMKQAGEQAKPRLRRHQSPPNLPGKTELEYQKQQDHYLCLVLMQPKLRGFLQMVTPEMFSKQPARQLFEFLSNNTGDIEVLIKDDTKLEQLLKGSMGAQAPEAAQVDDGQGADEQRTEPYNKYGEGAAESAAQPVTASSDTVGGSADEYGAAVRRFREYVKILSVIYEELYQGLVSPEIDYEASRLRTRLIEAYVKHQKAQLAQQLKTANESNSQQLLTKAKELDLLLKQSARRD